MQLRKGYVLAWLGDKRLVTFETGGGRHILPLFTSQGSAAAAARRVPIPPDGVLIAIEVLADESGGLKQLAPGGGMYDMRLDWSRLQAMWDTEPGFEEQFERGIPGG